ncbi:hypothetical protein BH23CHL2_BH23CHL2_29370 [soil metagenome]
MEDANRKRPIGVYEYLDYDDVSEIYRPCDQRAPEVARHVAGLIRKRMPDARVEHVGSSAIAGCGGKGIVDLLLMYGPGRLVAARDALDSLGFQKQLGADPFPEERPLRLGSYEYEVDVFRLHVHVVAADDPEVREQLYFRDRLNASPDLVEEYIAMKRASIAGLRTKPANVAHNIAYNAGKEPFIRRILAELDDSGGEAQPCSGRENT